MNAESSRSHSIFAIMVESYDKTSKRTTIGKLSIVDLAGSERADKTGASADRLKYFFLNFGLAFFISIFSIQGSSINQ
jgi:hypothetical protein